MPSGGTPPSRNHVTDRVRLVCVMLAPVVIGISLWLVQRIPDLTSHIRLFWTAYGFAFVVYAGGIWFFRAQCPRWSESQVVVFVLATGLVLRLILLPYPPNLSTDLYRYRWDGLTANRGISPYRFAPGAKRLLPFRDRYWRKINHKELTTIYPPVSQWVFRQVTRITPSPLAMKGIFAFCDFLVLYLILSILAASHLPPGRAVVYAWNPLVLVEVAGNGHQDVIGLLLLVAAFRAMTARRGMGAEVTSGMLAGLATMSKGYALLLFPLWARCVSPSAILAWGGTLLLFFAGAVHTANFLPALAVYGHEWQGNASLFLLIQWALSRSGPTVARIASLSIAVGASWLIARRCRADDIESRSDSIVLTFFVFLLLSPVAYPWYLLWLLPFTAIKPRLAVIGWSGIVVLAYGWYLHQAPAPALNLIEYILVGLLLAGETGWAWKVKSQRVR